MTKTNTTTDPDSAPIQLQKKASAISLFVSVFILIIKSMAYYYSHSAAILSDALESIVNVSAALVALIVIHISTQPKDRNHPYGHGKIEFFSAAFEGGFIFFASITILLESIKAFINPNSLRDLQSGILLVFISSVLNLFLGLYLKKVGNQLHSETLKASSAHIMADVWTTIGVLIGSALVLLTKWNWLDPFIGILVSLHLGYTGSKIIRNSFAGLMDEVDPFSLEQLAKALNSCDKNGFIDMHELKILRSGAFHHIDAHLVIPEFWNISEAHSWTEELAQEIVAIYPHDGEFAFHLDPCRRSYCEICNVKNCPVRIKAFKNKKVFTAELIAGQPTPSNAKGSQDERN